MRQSTQWNILLWRAQHRCGGLGRTVADGRSARNPAAAMQRCSSVLLTPVNSSSFVAPSSAVVGELGWQLQRQKLSAGAAMQQCVSAGLALDADILAVRASTEEGTISGQQLSEYARLAARIQWLEAARVSEAGGGREDEVKAERRGDGWTWRPVQVGRAG